MKENYMGRKRGRILSGVQYVSTVGEGKREREPAREAKFVSDEISTL